ncbi:ABC transporter permease [Corynebacterium sp. ES2794-CONJ1]|uniref:ABC transporter permease n=1 Tax=unclassified Corynebacterium TaxID=2624378 RepID=UPI00216AEC7B|nr:MULTISPECIES: ABC transporter permease [unclassified Corynebacterium]MCS4531010.1 ABC transporter permease [Corynebacterium sp. ES2730-CONJ]MCU9518377.1 ABC transporter permease [Corynebacterium sp. ES2794-CONJ1]
MTISQPQPGHIPPGIFSPQPQRASVMHMLKSQGKIEALLFLRHGEQFLLSFVIPIGIIIAAYFLPQLDTYSPHSPIFPTVLAIAAMSSGFSGQAISLAFDRRYGALKRAGASGVPASTIILGKVVGLLVVSSLQVACLTLVALITGWRTTFGFGVIGVVIFFVGVACFTALGMFLGGTLSSEMVLGLANLIWVLLVGAASYLTFNVESIHPLYHIIPSVALADGIGSAFAGQFPGFAVLSLIVWTILGIAASIRFFSFTD